jgi:hypothetical protein
MTERSSSSFVAREIGWIWKPFRCRNDQQQADDSCPERHDKEVIAERTGATLVLSFF